MKALLLHGFMGNSKAKMQILQGWGWEVERPRLSNISFKRAVRVAQTSLDGFFPDVIIGSSRGASVALALQTNKPLVLLAPAWRRFGTVEKTSNRAFVIHGTADTVIPHHDSVLLCEKSQCATLRTVEDDHRLLGPKGIEALFWAAFWAIRG